MKIKFNNLYDRHKIIEEQLVSSFIKSVRNSEFIGGREIRKFENNFKKLNQSKYCVSCSNGSDALVIAIKALSIKKTPAGEIMDELGIIRLCCRKTFFTSIDIINEI